MSAPVVHTGPDRGPLLLSVCWTLTSLSTVFVAMRLYCRVNYQARVWWDDFWMTLALVFSWVMTVTWTVYSRLGGTAYEPMSPEDIVTTSLLSWISQCWSMAGLVFGKLAVGCLILRLQAPAKWRTYLIWTLCIIAVIWNTLEVILIFAQCTPVQSLWNVSIKGTCWSPVIVVNNGIAVSAYLAFMDLALAVIPVHMIWGLKMPLGRKIGICFLLSTGVFAFAMAVLKADMITADLNRDTDFVQTAVYLFLWNSCEVNSVIIAGCIPTCMPIFEKMRGRNPHPNGKPRTRLLFGRSFGTRGGSAPASNVARSAVRKPSVPLSRKGGFPTVDDYEFEKYKAPQVTTVPRCTCQQNVDMGRGIQVTREFDLETGRNDLTPAYWARVPQK